MKARIVHNIILIAVSLVLASCASGYQSFYRPVDGESAELLAAKRASLPSAIPIIERAALVDGQAILLAYAKRGYVMIGSSFFNSGSSESDNNAVDQARRVGADLVLVFNPQYTGSVTSNVPITTPTSTTSYTSGSATAFGSGAPVTAYGSTTTTTYGTQTTYIPITVHRHDYGAIYFAKFRFSFGAFFRDLNDHERQELETNQGVAVLTVVDDSPAFKADILPGDVIIAINETIVPNSAGATRILEEQKGKEAHLRLVRRGQRIDKVVLLNN